MTVNDKRRMLKNYCQGRACAGCPLGPLEKCHINSPDATDDVINRQFEKLFGLIINGTSDELVAIVDDADTVIKIKSNRKIDNVTIYFKEEK